MSNQPPYNLFINSISISNTILDELRSNKPNLGEVQKLMKQRSESLSELEDFVYSDVWKENKETADTEKLRYNYNKLSDLDIEIRNHLAESVKKSDMEFESISKELKAQNSYNKSGESADSSLFIERKLHG